jgi:hypothetical protein
MASHSHWAILHLILQSLDARTVQFMPLIAWGLVQACRKKWSWITRAMDFAPSYDSISLPDPRDGVFP